MKIAIGSDHAGFRYKQAIIAHLQLAGHEVADFGTNSEVPVSYVTFIRPERHRRHPRQRHAQGPDRTWPTQHAACTTRKHRAGCRAPHQIQLLAGNRQFNALVKP